MPKDKYIASFVPLSTEYINFDWDNLEEVSNVLETMFVTKRKTMPLKIAKSKSKKAINKAVSANIEELVHHGKRKRSMAQIIAISENAARKDKGGKYLVKKKSK